MTHVSHYALQKSAGRSVGPREFFSDVLRGLMATSRLLVTAVGCLTLIAAAVLMGNDQVREQVVAALPTPPLFAAGRWAAAEAASPMADPAAPSPAAQGAGDLVTQIQQRQVTQYLARRYRVADEAVRQLVQAAYSAGQDQRVDPLLVLAVMAIESSMNPFAESHVGAQGLMQVMTSVHAARFEVHGGEHAALDPMANIKVGTAILADMIRRGGSVERALQLYVGAGNLSDDGGYGARVLAERGRIALAASGRVDAALMAGLRVAAQGEVKAVPAVSAGIKPAAAAKPADGATLPDAGAADQPASDKAV